MKALARRLVAVHLALLALAVAVAGAGCDDAGPLTEAEYEGALESAFGDIRVAVDEVFLAYEWLYEYPADEVVGAERLDEVRSAFDELRTAVEAARADFGKHVPPEGYEEVHGAVVAGLDAYAEAAGSYQVMLDALDAGSSIGDVQDGIEDARNAIRSEHRTAFEGLEDAAEQLGLEDEFYEAWPSGLGAQ